MTDPLRSEQFRRSYRLDVDKIRVESTSGSAALRIAFDVQRKHKVASAEPNTVKVQIWNMNEAHRSALEALEDGVELRLEVGYQKKIGQIFFGTLSRVSSQHTGKDWITEITGGDGKIKLRAATINRSFAAGAPLIDVVTAFVDALELKKGSLDLTATELGQRALSHGTTFSGPVAEEMSAFCRSEGFVWSIQDGEFTLSRLDEPVPDTRGPRIAPDTGLIGAPRIDSKGRVIGVALIQPDLVPGVPFRLESSRVTGDFVAEVTKHSGDSIGKEWFVEFAGKAIDPKQAKKLAGNGRP